MVSLFYVGQNDNQLSCLDWGPSGNHSPCPINLEQSHLAVDSRQISATWIPTKGPSPHLLIAYQDPSQKLVVLRLSSIVTSESSTSILNETAKFNSALNEEIQTFEPGSPDAYLAKTCTAVSFQDADDFRESFYFNCFTKQHNGEAPSEMDGHSSETLTQESKFAEFMFYVNISNRNITVDNSMPTYFRCRVSSKTYRVQRFSHLAIIDYSVQNPNQRLYRPIWKR